MAGLPGIPIRLRRDTEAEWAADNPVLKLGETGWTTDTLRVKLGDGVTAWNDLPFAADEAADVAVETAARIAADIVLQDQIDDITGSDVETVAGVSPVGGDIVEATLKTALDLPADTNAELANRATDAELAAEAVLARNADNLTGGTVADARIAASIARLASPALTGAPTAPTQSAGDNSTKIATTAYADALIAAADAMIFKGVIDASANPNYPAADKGWTYRISVAGKIGGASGDVVQVGDILLCLVDGSAAGTQATVGANWSIAQTNIDGAVIGPASAVDNRVALFDAATGKLIKDSGVLIGAIALLASPVFTGDPTGPTRAVGNNGTSLATTQFVNNEIANDAILKTFVDAKGDLVAASANDTPAILAVGANRAQLVADSAQATGLRWTTALRAEGAGSPEGVVTAPVGSIYTDSVATLGVVEWLKASGAGNTGWTPAGGYNWTPSSDLVTGRYYFAGSQDGAGAANTLGTTLRVMPFVIAKTTSLARLFAEFTVAGDAASVLRLGIYADTGAGYPGALVLDAGSISTGSGNAGTVATGGTPGVYEITINQSLAPGLYWFGGVVQGVTVTQPTIRTVARGPNLPLGFSAIPTAGQTAIGYGQSGVSGALPAFSAGQGIVGAGPRVGFRVT